jgi:hypothetical protein
MQALLQAAGKFGFLAGSAGQPCATLHQVAGVDHQQQLMLTQPFL